MLLSDRRIIAASPARVWSALVDPEVLKSCIPGCTSFTGSITTGYEAVVVQKIGPVPLRVTGSVTVQDVLPDRSVTLTAAGKGGVAGFAQGGARVTLAPEGTGTLLSYAVDISFGGRIAQLGEWIIHGFARKLAGRFFDRFANAIEAPREPAPGQARTDLR